MQPNSITALLNPDQSDAQRFFWDKLKKGNLSFQRCTVCGHAWLPARSECPQCLGTSWNWEIAKGEAKLVSWVIYHHAYHPAFAGRLPYLVAIVELAEGPRMISNLIQANPATLRIDQALQLKIETEESLPIPRFIPL